MNRQDWLESRAKNVNSTEVSALFGCNPWLTHFELWHRKKSGSLGEIQENDRMKWGSRLQESIAQGIAKDNNWDVGPYVDYMTIGGLKIGSSFDYAIKTDGKFTALLEIKNVDALAFKDGWIVDGEDIEAPPHIELQVQHQLLVSGLPLAYIGALVGGNRVVLLKREVNTMLHHGIKTAVAEFWKSIDENKEPEPTMPKDAKFIAKLYSHAEPGKIFDATNNAALQMLANQYREYGSQIKELEKQRESAKAEILRAVEDAEKIIGGNWTASLNLVGPAHIEYDRAGYRNFKLNWKKETK